MYLINKTEKISEERWIEVVNSHKNILSIREHEGLGLDKDFYGYAIFKFKNKIIGRLIWDWEYREITVETKQKLTLDLSIILQDIASKLNAQFYINKREIFDPQRHLPFELISIDRNEQYFESYELDELRWLAIRSDDVNSILSIFKLEVDKKDHLSELLKEEKDDFFIITPSHKGWTFLIGINLPYLFTKGNETSSNEALTNQIKSMQKYSKALIEIQYFEYSSKSNTNGYIKTKNGKLIYAKWESEVELFTKGKIPKELKKMNNPSAHDVASIWSVDSMDFIYVKELAERLSLLVIPIPQK